MICTVGIENQNISYQAPKEKIMQVQFKILIKLHEKLVYSDSGICRSSFQRDF